MGRSTTRTNALHNSHTNTVHLDSPGKNKHILDCLRRATIRDKYWATNIAGWKLWPAAHVINFALVPPSQRILYANVVSVRCRTLYNVDVECAPGMPQILGTYILSRVANKQGQHAELTIDSAAIND